MKNVNRIAMNKKIYERGLKNHSVMVIVTGNGHCNPSSNPGQSCLHFTLCKYPTILPPARGK